jgi:hypothetical protein
MSSEQDVAWYRSLIGIMGYPAAWMQQYLLPTRGSYRASRKQRALARMAKATVFVAAMVALAVEERTGVVRAIGGEDADSGQTR